MCIRTHTHAYTLVQAQTSTHAHIHAQTRIRVHTQQRTQPHTNTHTRTRSLILAHTQPHTHTYTHIYAHKRTGARHSHGCGRLYACSPTGGTQASTKYITFAYVINTATVAAQGADCITLVHVTNTTTTATAHIRIQAHLNTHTQAHLNTHTHAPVDTHTHACQCKPYSHAHTRRMVCNENASTRCETALVLLPPVTLREPAALYVGAVRRREF